jgi:hypothetical protein
MDKNNLCHASKVSLGRRVDHRACGRLRTAVGSKWALRRSVCSHVDMCTCFIVREFRYKQEMTD